MRIVVLGIKGVVDPRYTRDESNVGEAKFLQSVGPYLRGLLLSAASTSSSLYPSRKGFDRA